VSASQSSREQRLAQLLDTIRRDLAALAAHGFLDCHGYGTPRRFYTPTTPRKDRRS
jgi:DeoR/GlpR family transcriptional regulator of sugar metabolism